MDHHLKASLLQALHRILKHRKSITTADEFRAFFMNGLKAQLHRDGLSPVQLPKHLHHFLRKAVRPGADGDPQDVLLRHGLRKDLPKPRHRSIGIGEGLKIPDVASQALLRKLALHQGLCPADLLLHRQPGRSGKVPGASGTAEDASPLPQGPVPVGTGAAGLQGQAIDLSAVLFLPLIIKAVERFLSPQPLFTLHHASVSFFIPFSGIFTMNSLPLPGFERSSMLPP